ncbi:MAG: Flp family type IVb pilin [Acidimicrobiales bacterium]
MALSLLLLRAHLRLVAPGRRGDDGASVVEYALLLALIAVVCLVAVNSIGEPTKGGLENVNSSGWGP